MKAGALFAGIGGFCLGFKEAGIPTSWAVEIDEYAGLTYRENQKGVRFISESVEAVSAQSHDLEPVDVLHAGFPCQSFSQAGERKGFSDPRGRLFYEIIRIVESFKDKKPKVIVLENSPFIKYGEGGVWFLELQRAIQNAGYWFRPDNCSELSAFDLTELPQQRTRLFMVALSMDHFASGRFTFPQTRSKKPKDLRRFIDFDGSVDSRYYLDRENRYYKMITKKVEDKNCIYQLRKYEVRAKEPGVCPTLTANMGLGGAQCSFHHEWTWVTETYRGRVPATPGIS